MFIKSEAGDFKLTIKQLYRYIEVYNLPVYFLDKEYVHYRDVVSLISKVAVEDKYNNREDVQFDSKKLETSILDLWTSNFPNLVDLREKYLSKSLESSLSYDIKLYIAYTTCQKAFRMSTTRRAVKMMKLSDIYGILSNPIEEVYRERLDANESKNKEWVEKSIFYELLELQKERTKSKMRNRTYRLPTTITELLNNGIIDSIPIILEKDASSRFNKKFDPVKRNPDIFHRKFVIIEGSRRSTGGEIADIFKSTNGIKKSKRVNTHDFYEVVEWLRSRFPKEKRSHHQL